MPAIQRNALGYPQFSEAEWARRDALAEEVMAREDLGALMGWLAHYPAQTPARLVRARGGECLHGYPFHFPVCG